MKRIVLLLFVLVGAYAYAQDWGGSIVRQITDPTGAASPPRLQSPLLPPTLAPSCTSPQLLTVTCSVAAPTSSCTLIVTFCWVSTLMSVLSKFLKPGAFTFTLYPPGIRLGAV